MLRCDSPEAIRVSSRRTVLIVDDSALIRTVLRDVISEMDGFDVIGTAADGREAIAAVKSLRPDIVTLDVEMPGLDGLATLEAIMRESPRPVVMLSGAATAGGVELTLRALELGAVDFVRKADATAQGQGAIAARLRTALLAAAATNIGAVSRATGQIVANIALRKQIFADEMGLMAASFVDETVLDIDLGVARREAVHFALRNMLQLATFELLTQLMPYEAYAECHALVDPRYGAVTGDRTTAEQEQMAADRAAALAAAEAAANGVEQTTLPPPAAPEEEVSAGAAAANSDGVLPENDPSQTVGGG